MIFSSFNLWTHKCLRATHLKFYIVIITGRSGQKLNLVITFDWRVLLTRGQRIWSELYFARSFQGYPTWPRLARPNTLASASHLMPLFPLVAPLNMAGYEKHVALDELPHGATQWLLHEPLFHQEGQRRLWSQGSLRAVFITHDVVLMGVDGDDAWAELKMVTMVEETHCQNFRTTTQPSSTRHAWTKTFSAKRMDFLVEHLTILPPAVMLGGIIAQFQLLM